MTEHKELTQEQVRGLRRVLVDFGYKVTEDYVRDRGNEVLNGQEPAEIIGMFIQGILQEHGVIS